ncbi:extracellular triacylglycerol lipase precursor [Mycena floridula]|nr:extracellular triacylglycerol lipase precursor [Mycena floridula]
MILLPAFSVLLALFPSSRAAEILLGNTQVCGSDDPVNGLEFFGGIPFAEPPTGKLRFQPPVPKYTLDDQAWFNASSFGPICPQPPSSLAIGGPPGPQLEDCLTINILRPNGTQSNALLPVMLWVYGGGFIAGASQTYRGEAFVVQSIDRGTPIIYVDFNYRVGPLGFPQGQEPTSKGLLNVGLKDQLVAMEWVQQNIGYFGGDKDKVTIFGESAGAVSLGTLMLNRDLSKVARAMIVQSGSAGLIPVFDALYRQAIWDRFVSNASPNCTDKVNAIESCLANADPTALHSAIIDRFHLDASAYSWPPVFDGPEGLMPDLPSKLYAQGKGIARIPTMLGTNLDEVAIGIRHTIDSSETIIEWIISNFTTGTEENKEQLNKAAQDLLNLYPDDPALGSPYNTGNETFGLSPEFKRISAIYGDLLFQAGRRLWSQTALKQGNSLYVYHLTDPITASPIFPPSGGVAHGNDLYYLFGWLPLFNGTSEAIQFAQVMRDYWISFATSLDPNDGKGSTRAHWPLHNNDGNAIMQLNHLDLKPVPDDYQAEGIAYINANAELFRH